MKVINIDKEEIKLNNDNLIVTIKKQNKIAVNERFHMQRKKIKRIKMIICSQYDRKEKKKDFLITETDEKIINIEQNEIKYRIEKVFFYSIIIILKDILKVEIIIISLLQDRY